MNSAQEQSLKIPLIINVWFKSLPATERDLFGPAKWRLGGDTMAIYTFIRKVNAREMNKLYLNNALDTTLLLRSILHLWLSVTEKVCQQEDLFVVRVYKPALWVTVRAEHCVVLY